LLCFRLSRFSLTKMIMFLLVLPRAHRFSIHMFRTHIHCTWTSKTITLIYWELHDQTTIMLLQFRERLHFYTQGGSCVNVLEVLVYMNSRNVPCLWGSTSSSSMKTWLPAWQPRQLCCKSLKTHNICTLQDLPSFKSFRNLEQQVL
jgi:hypothetical protein